MEYERKIEMTVYEKLAALGIELPAKNGPAAHYSPLVRTGNLVFTAGQTPKKEGKLVFLGKLGQELTLEEGYEAARLCTINNLANINALCGGLDRVERIVKVTCYIASTADFFGQAKVADGVTDLLSELFGENGVPARSAVGTAVLPGNSPVEVEMVVELKP